MASKLEGEFRKELITLLQDMFDGCFIFSNHPVALRRQGIPDILILYKDRWAMLELKRSSGAARQPNQAYYVEMFNQMSYAAFISPENMEDILYELQLALGLGRSTRIS